MDANGYDLLKLRVRSKLPEDPFRAVLCCSFALMVWISGSLWVDTDRFPRVPFVRGLPNLPSDGAFLEIALIATALFGVVSRRSLAVSLAILGWLVLKDQNRFQPWVYQYGLSALALASSTKRQAWGLARVFIIALYFHSGISKLDVSFCRETGPWMVGALLNRAGIAWRDDSQGWYYLLLPAAESAVGLGLCFRKTRSIALAGALAMHAALLLFLGPLGRRQSGDLIVWNVSLMAEDWILFGGAKTAESEKNRGETVGRAWVRLIFVFAAMLPFGERFGLWDAWPSFAYYAGHVERTEIWIDQEAARDLPIETRRALQKTVEPTWLRLDLVQWSRAVRGVPVYPSNRTANGLAQAIARRLGPSGPVRIVEWSRADRFSGSRDRRVAVGWGPIRRLGERFQLNSTPEGSFGERISTKDSDTILRQQGK